MWLTAVGLAGLLAAEVWLGARGVRAWLPFAALLPATGIVLWWLGRIRVAVREGELLVDDARLPVRFAAEVIALDAAGRREVLGIGADPLAFVVQRPWIAGAVQVVLNDADDPTPYWVVSSRHPVRLAEAIRSAREAGRITRR
jgi:acyl transferase domain-containing protein